MESGADTGEMPRCYVHPELLAGGFCVSCGKPICPNCAVDVAGKNNCKNCLVEKASAPARSTERNFNVSKRQLVGLTGSTLLFLGVFTPIVSLPIVGSVNYFNNGKGDGIFILAFALISIALIYKEKFKGLWITGLGSAGIMAYTFYNVESAISKAQSELSDNPFAALVNIQLQWGWALLASGAILLLATAIVNDAPEQSAKV